MRRDVERHRRALLDAARTVFARDGTAAPLDAVVSESGLGRGTLYRHFANRSELMLALIQSEVAHLLAFVQSHGDDRTLVVDFLMEQANAAAFYMEVASAIAEDGGFHELRRMRVLADRLHQEVIDRGKAAGTLGPDVDVATFLLIGRMLMPARQLCIVEGSTAPLDAALRIVLNGIGPRDTRDGSRSSP